MKKFSKLISAIIFLAQLKNLRVFIRKRLKIQKFYNDHLPQEIGRPVYSGTCQFYSASVDKKYRADLMDFLAKKKIHTTVHYKPLHLHPIFKQKRIFPVADIEWKKFISFPCHSAMTLKDAKYVVYFVKKFFKR